jgi:hypothetical protein
MAELKYNLEHVKNTNDILKEVGERLQRCVNIINGEFKAFGDEFNAYISFIFTRWGATTNLRFSARG